jgi:hypothetical protein
MLTDVERQSTIERIARSLERFDDDTLSEMARLTDPETRNPQPPAPPTDVTRRRVLVAFAAGAGSIGAAALGLFRLRDGALAGIDAERLRRVEALSRDLEAVGMDDTLGAGLSAVGAALAQADLARQALVAALRDMAPQVEAAVAVVDVDLADKARDRLFGQAQSLADSVTASIRSWSDALEGPVTRQLDQRAALRRDLTAALQ